MENSNISLNNSELKTQPQPHYHFFKKRAFGVLIVAFLALKIGASVLIPNRHYTEASDLTPQNILTAVNRERSLRNLVTLNTNDKLGAAAQSKADDMITRKYFAHVDPDGHYIWDKIVADGYTPYAQLGENLAIEFYDTDSLMSAWMNSPEHRANILQEGFRDQGMGLSFGDVQQGQYYSAIANTFGTLAVSKATTVTPTPVPKPTPKPTITTTPSPAQAPVPPAPMATTTPAAKPTPTIQKQASSSPIQNPAPSSTTATTDPTPISTAAPLTLRGIDSNQPAAQNNFAVPSSNDTSTAPTSAAASLSPIFNPAQSASAVVGTKDVTEMDNYDVNRYLILICGVFLVLLLGSDIQKAIANKFGSLDKKVNNLALLIITMVVVAFMYWL